MINVDVKYDVDKIVSGLDNRLVLELREILLKDKMRGLVFANLVKDHIGIELQHDQLEHFDKKFYARLSKMVGHPKPMIYDRRSTLGKL